jgi:DNA-binding NarL/FixJ family response regulator
MCWPGATFWPSTWLGRELLAAGETARKRTTLTSDQLTAQEIQVAELAREGLSSIEIGSRLFISRRRKLSVPLNTLAAWQFSF